MKPITEQRRQELIDDCEKDILNLSNCIRKCLNLNLLSEIPYYESQLERQKIALASLTAEKKTVRPFGLPQITGAGCWVECECHEDGIHIGQSPPQRKNLPMETVELTIQECLKGKPMVFVFGSNEQGIHGAGAALFARKSYGAQMGKGIGHYGNSYALPTKSTPVRSLNLREIATHVGIFLAYARDHQEYSFKVTAVGCGLAGFKPEQIAPLFNGAPNNCYFDSSWKEFMIPETQYWGTV